MCGIAGFIALNHQPVREGGRILSVMSAAIAHRGPDGDGSWLSPDGSVGLAHRRLAIIDTSAAAAQPMAGADGSVLTYNGEIYNFEELRILLAGEWTFRSASDTETILAAHARYGVDALQHLRGMFAFALWDDSRRRLFCARDRFGIKPLYYAVVADVLLFASEAKALLPFLPEIATDHDALGEYLTFQFPISDRTLFSGLHQLSPGHAMTVEDGRIRIWRYWDIHYTAGKSHRASYYRERTAALLRDSVDVHLRSDVPVGAYLSGGMDSTLTTLLASRSATPPRYAFHGRFQGLADYDESAFAHIAAESAGLCLEVADITATDFTDHIGAVVRALDYPLAGPGSFAQYMVSRLAATRVKTVLGGQGGDELFAGYARYLLAYFEQCLKAAIDGTAQGRFVVTAQSIIPNLGALREYKPLIREFWRQGLFGPMDDRYLRLVDRSTDAGDEIDWDVIDRPRVVADFKTLFDSPGNVGKEAYLDKMMHFDLKTLLPALLHVEDRMSMAWGLESRVPFLDHHLVEFTANVPAIVKFKGGVLKRLLRESFTDLLPPAILNRRDKMGFPVPLKEWFGGPLADFVQDTLGSERAVTRSYVRRSGMKAGLGGGGQFSRRLWGLLCLEVWQQEFHDRATEIRRDAPRLA